MKQNDSGKKIAFIVPYPLGFSPGQRFRFEQYLSALSKQNYSIEIKPFITAVDYERIYSASLLSRVGITLKGYARRARLLFSLGRYDFLYVYRETSPLGPPVLAWLNRIVYRVPLVYDFDDAIWMRDEGGEPRWLAALKWKRKVATLCGLAQTVVVGNRFLADYARKFTRDVRIIPTVVDTESHHKRTQAQGDQLVIGWTGSHSTLVYLESIIPVVRELRKKHEFRFRIIANRDPGYADDFIEFIPWNRNTEITDLEALHIGVMPLNESPWSEGKCGFKAIQYLALGIPAVASPVGVNTAIVQHGKTGYLASQHSEWARYLEALLTSPGLRDTLGRAGRETIRKNYSVAATTGAFLEIFR